MLGYARSLFEAGKWTELADDFRNADGGNSHSPRIGVYQRMLDAYGPMREQMFRDVTRPSGYSLTAAELTELADAAIHPSRRGESEE